MVRSLIAIAALAVFATLSAAQDLTRRAPKQVGVVVITGATIHRVSGPAIQGAVAFENGRITTVGATPPPGGATVIDARGKHVYPGMISAVTQLGLTEIASVRASRDITETGDVTPEARASVAVNPDSTLFPVTRQNGVLSAGVFPSGGVIPGRAAVIQLEGWTHEDMTVLDDAGVVLNWPSMRTGGGRGRFLAGTEEDRSRESGAAVARIDEVFRAAAAYAAASAADPSIPTDLRLAAMRRVLPRSAAESAPATDRPASRPGPERPVFIHAQEYDQILGALAFATRHGVRPVIIGGRDALLAADMLKARDVAVIVSGTFRMPRRADSPYDDAYTLPARLEAAGVRWCLASGDETPHERNLPYAAALAAAHGLDQAAALRSVTLSAAEILGCAADLGSIDVGKLATLVITDGDPLEVTTKIERAFIGGREIELTSKQTKLAEKYREKYPPIAPAGK